MRTTIVIDDKKLDRLMTLIGCSKKSEAINSAVDHFLYCQRKQKLLDLMGQLNIEEDWQASRALELEEG